jgi:hypothetical protein
MLRIAGGAIYYLFVGFLSHKDKFFARLVALSLVSIRVLIVLMLMAH